MFRNALKIFAVSVLALGTFAIATPAKAQIVIGAPGVHVNVGRPYGYYRPYGAYYGPRAYYYGPRYRYYAPYRYYYTPRRYYW